MRFTYSYRGQTRSIELIGQGQQYLAAIENRNRHVKVEYIGGGGPGLVIDGEKRQAAFVRDGRNVWIYANGRTYLLKRQSGLSGTSELLTGDRILRAPMPGQVRKIIAEAGKPVKPGETLLLLEAMKMEIRIQSPHSGKVARIAVSEGQSVEREQILVELDVDTQ